MISQEYYKIIRYLQWPIFFDKKIAISLVHETSRKYFSFITIEKSIFSGRRWSNASKKFIFLISFLSTSAKNKREKVRTNATSKLHNHRRDFFSILTLETAATKYDVARCCQFLVIGWVSNHTQMAVIPLTRRIGTQGLIFIRKKKRRWQSQEMEFLMYVLPQIRHPDKKRVPGFD